MATDKIKIEKPVMTTEKINEMLNITDTFDAPSRLMDILQDRVEREKIFIEMRKLSKNKLNYDWFSEYFQETFADKKRQGQVHTPPHIANLLAMLLLPQTGGFVLEPCAGTGSLTIGQWNQISNRKNYRPSDHLFICEELSANAIPFLIFNLAIKGVNAVVNHCDVMTRESQGVFFIYNEKDNPKDFSTINRMPYIEFSEKLFDVKFVNERYPEQAELNVAAEQKVKEIYANKK